MSESVTPLRLVFAGTPEFAAVHLQALIDSSHQVVAVYTQPDRPAGRGKKLTASPVKHLAQAASIPVYQPASLRDSPAQRELAELEPDALVVVAYGLLLPQVVLDIPRFGCINVHASLLPRWRGAAPIQRAIEADRSELNRPLGGLLRVRSRPDLVQSGDRCYAILSANGQLTALTKAPVERFD